MSNGPWATRYVKMMPLRNFYSDSFGSKGLSDYVEYEDDLHPTDTEKQEDDDDLKHYSRRQKVIIRGVIPEHHHRPSLRELSFILDRAYRLEDEYVIDRLFMLYPDELSDDEDEEDMEQECKEFYDLLQDYLSR